jgi:hypothetical protein
MLLKRVVAQALKDAVSEHAKLRSEVVHWLVSPDFITIMQKLQLDPDEWRLKIANLFRDSRQLAVWRARRLNDELWG